MYKLVYSTGCIKRVQFWWNTGKQAPFRADLFVSARRFECRGKSSWWPLPFRLALDFIVPEGDLLFTGTSTQKHTDINTATYRSGQYIESHKHRSPSRLESLRPHFVFSWKVKAGTEAGSSLPRCFLFFSACLKFGCLCFQRSSDEAAGDSERDTENGHLIYKSGDVLEDRCMYQFSLKCWQPLWKAFNCTSICFTDEIVDTLGEGTFGKVVQCSDHSR